METPTTARLARRRSEATYARAERRYTRSGARSAYSCRRANRADRQATRSSLRASWPVEPDALDSYALDALVGLEPDWMAI